MLIIVLLVLWYFEKLPTFSTNYLPNQNLNSGDPVQVYEHTGSNDDGYIISEEPEETDDVQEGIQSDNLIDESPFKPLKKANQYMTLSLAGDVNQFASSGLPLPNTSLYNVSTRSYMSGLGDPIRGDLDIKPLTSDLYKSKFIPKDTKKTGALASIS